LLESSIFFGDSKEIFWLAKRYFSSDVVLPLAKFSSIFFAQNTPVSENVPLEMLETDCFSLFWPSPGPSFA